jgi:iron complex outermembrane recepter protein
VHLRNLGDIAVRLTVAAAISCIFLSSLPAAEHAAAAVTQMTDIPPEGLSSALETFARDRKLQLIYVTDDVESRHTDGAVGNLSTADALKRILNGTGLSYQFLDDKTVTVQPTSPGPRTLQTGNVVENATDGAGSRREYLRLAQSTGGQSSGPSTVSNSSSVSTGDSSNSGQLEEVLVTAQKKTERLQDVPVPVSVLSPAALVDQNKLSISDYATSVPSFVVAPVNFGEQQLAIRGITTGAFTLPTVGVTIDGVPYGGLIDVPDIDPGDLARVEILRGPQGTLYGSSSMGGLINFVTKAPSFDGYSGSLQTGTNLVDNGTGAGYSLRGGANVPINDTIAMRVSGYTYTDPGYIDNPVYNLQGVNRTDAYGGRAAFLFQPSDAFSIKFSTLYDHIDHRGSSEVNVPTPGYPNTIGLGDLQQNYIPGVGGQRDETKAFSLTLNAQLGAYVNLVSLTGYNDVYDPSSFDWSDSFGANALKNFGVDAAANVDYTRYKKITQELRLSGSFAGDFDWLLGGFYSHTKLYGDEVIYAADPTTGRFVGADWIIIYPRTYQEAAAFANLTWHITDRFDIQVGGRESQDEERDLPETQSGPYVATGPFTEPLYESKDNAFTYLVTPQFKISQDLMVYARLASGFRPGGPNTVTGAGIPSAYSPDKTKNYELGTKGDFLDRRLTVDASLYYIDWKNIQLQKFSPSGITFSTNGSAAKSEGVELSLIVRPTQGLSISGWYAYDNAVLTQPFQANGPLYGVTGDRLPLSSRNSGNLSVRQDLPINAATTGFLAATEIFVGDRVGVFTSTSQRQDLPGYEQTDLHAGVTHNSWETSFYVNNLTNERGVINGGLGYILPYAFIDIPPRTVGLNIKKSF